MQSVVSRGRLLAGAALGLGLSILAPSRAEAACTVSSVFNPTDTLTCGSTTTSNTTYGTNLPNDRNYPFTSSPPTFMIVSPGALVDGFGLSFTNSVGGTDPLTITNSGAVQVDAGNTATAGGSAALGASVIGGTGINYSGSGSVANFGIGDGLRFDMNGTGILSANIGGSVRADAGDAIRVIATDVGSGAIGITTTAGQTVRASGGDGIEIDTVGSGDVVVVNNAAISSGGVGVNTLFDGINVNSTGTGDMSVTGNGAIGTAGDRAQGKGINALISNGASAGDVTISTGTGGVFSTGIGVEGQTFGSGNVLVTAGTGGVDSLGLRGVSAVATTGSATVITNGPVTVTGIGSGAVLAQTTSGAINITTNGTVTGAANANSSGISGFSTTGNQVLNVNGAVTAGGWAIFSPNSAGTRAITLGTGGSLTGGINSILATGTGAVTIISAGLISGPLSLSTAADSVTNSGTMNLTGTTLLAAGADTLTNATGGTISLTGVTDFGTDIDSLSNNAGATLTIGAGSSLLGLETLSNAGTASAISGLTFDAGNTVLTNSGTVFAAGTMDFGGGTDSLTNIAGGTFNGAGLTLNGLETLGNAGTFNANGGLTFDAGNTAVTNTGTLNVNATLDFGGGTDSFANSGAGIVNLMADTTLANVETVTNTGRINLDTFTLTGPAIAFTNSGTIDSNGSAGLTGFTTFSNAATLNLAAGTFTAPAGGFTNTGTILADEGATLITGQSSFDNGGTIRLLDGGVGDVLTINGPFVGSAGSILTVDFNETVADNLVITGAASGTTTVNATYIGSGVINSSGILVVETGGAAADAFVLGTVTGGSSALIDFSLVEQADDFFLFATPNALALQPVLVGAVTQDIWYQSADAYSSYSVLRRSDLGADRKNGIGLWAQLYGSNDRYGHKGTQSVFGFDVGLDNTVKTDRRGGQAGADFLAGNRFVVGVTGGYEHAKANNQSGGGGVDAEGYNAGLYGQFGGATGIYAGLIAKMDWNDVRLTSSAFGDADGDPDSKSTGVEGEVGYRMSMGGVGVDFGAGLAYVRTKVDGFTVGGITYDFDNGKSLRGRLGVRGEFGGSLGLFADGKLYHEFEGDNELALISGSEIDTVDIDGRGTWARFETGFGSRMKPGPMLSAWVDVGDVTGLGIRGGFRF